MFLRLFFLPLVLAVVVKAQESTPTSSSSVRNRQGTKPTFKVNEKPKFVNEKLHQDFLVGLQKRRPPIPSPTVDPQVTATPFSVFDFFTRKNNPFKVTPETIIVHRFSATTSTPVLDSRPFITEPTSSPKLGGGLILGPRDRSMKFKPKLE